MSISRLAVFGTPISHSLSPVLFESTLRDQLSDSFYIRVTGLEFSAIRSFAERIGLEFANVTHPFKEDAAGLTEKRDNAVKRTHAANGIRWLDGDLEVWNTDPGGVQHALLSHWKSLEGKSTLVIGAGGAGRAAVEGLLQGGGSVYVWNRTGTRLRETCVRYPDVIAVNSDNLQHAISRMDGIVWTIPGYPAFLRKLRFNAKQIVLDANYGWNMQITQPFTPAVRIDGVHWLAGQAAESMRRLGLHVSAPSDLVSQAARFRPLTSGKKALPLIGFMGSGKTTLGRILAGKLNREFVDLDTLIEETDGRTIPEIFQQSGEDTFRKLEAETLSRLDLTRGPVIATGGGVPSNPNAAAWLAENASSIWLYRPLTELKNMAEGSEGRTRPLLRVGEVDHLFNQRVVHYAKQSDMVVAQGLKDTLEDTAELLMREPLVATWKVPSIT